MAKWGEISRAFNCTESNDTPNKPDTQIDEWDTMAEAARFALDQLIFKGDKLADRIEELEAKLFTCATDLDTYMNAHAALEDKLAQQDDLVQAAVAAALREAVSAVKQSADDDDISLGAAQWVIDDILDLITPDAQAALDRVVAEVLTQAADAVEDYCSNAPDLAGHGHSGAIRDVILALITEDAQAALDRVVAAERTMRPIGTAPRDGTYILVTPYGDPTDLQVSWFIEGEDRWANWSWSVEPSHWFPLPAIRKGGE